MMVNEIPSEFKLAGDFMVRIPRHEVAARALARKFLQYSDPRALRFHPMHDDAVYFATRDEYHAFIAELGIEDPTAHVNQEVCA